ncbi:MULTISPECIES: LuxR C-terminal-related transcriptional regulator [Shewanella]|uniref:LuxR C-terminal-related transcriptional regulator n=1 Tax=Shewanella TaxID=22 RepID=UPI001181F43D|nr:MULTISPECIES: LuxR C-terminal-related transcriptional regulator [Shewanella]QYJ88377.1 LuxR C-terminal-related transcriptional regulator [Shewanella halotolerans]QYJ95459.1 LuxR C-terminal-related transcriptional regulator [Shewanella spartinae]QYK14573.1 LuxR C-terminal-related transcriptional regulator [Shewanella rhizosphaerae]TVP16101.1 helix-turn-helix transcriptional regulator [Shewanella sp. KCT]
MFKVINWVVVSRSQLLIDLLETRWPQEFLVKLAKVTPESVEVTMSEGNYSLVVIDLATIDVQRAYQVQKQIEKRHSARVVFLHYPKQIDARFLISPITAAVFYGDASLEHIGKALANVLRGQTVIPHALLSASADQEQLDGADNLTIREREVLQALLSGSTNVDIANQLFVSESTIKTHLYRVFRKIGVSSRGQAIAWAQTHLHEVQQ